MLRSFCYALYRIAPAMKSRKRIEAAFKASVAGVGTMRSKRAHGFARVPDGDAIGGDIFDDDASAADDGIVADGHARHDLRAAADPHVISDGDWGGGFAPPIAQLRVDGVLSGIESAIRTDEDVVAEGDGRAIENDGVVIGKEVVSEADIIAVIAPKRRHDEERFPRRGLQKPHDDIALAFDVGGGQLIESEAEIFGAEPISDEFAAIGIVQFAAEHFLFFGFCHDDVALNGIIRKSRAYGRIRKDAPIGRLRRRIEPCKGEIAEAKARIAPRRERASRHYIIPRPDNVCRCRIFDLVAQKRQTAISARKPPPKEMELNGFEPMTS